MKNRIQYFLLGLLVVFVIAAATPISFLKLMSDADGNQHSITNLASISVDEIHGDATNQFAAGSGGGGLTSSNYVNKIGVAIYPTDKTNFWWDFGLTNDAGPIVYQTISATNNVNFLGVTNGFQWGLISVNVTAVSGDRIISVPTNLPHFNTNGFTLSGTSYRFTLTNGNEFRISVHSNSTLSTMWATFGQGAGGSTTGSGSGGGDSSSGWSQQPTNTSTTGYVIYASGTNSYWASPPSGGSGGSNSVLQSFYRYNSLTWTGTGTWPIFWQLGDVQAVNMNGAGGSFTIADAGWKGTTSSQFETHKLILTCRQSSIAVSYPDTWVFITEAPSTIYSNQVVLYTLSRVGDKTNILVTAQTSTNSAVSGL